MINEIIAETERLIITNFDDSMAYAVHILSIDEVNRKFQPDEVFETEKEALDTIKYLAANYGNTDAPQVHPVLLKETGENIGHVELVPIGEDEWEIGYHIGAKFSGRDYATEAVKVFLPVMMKKFGLQHVIGICVSENAASRRVMNKCDFDLEFEGMHMYHGEMRSCCIFRYR